MDKVQTKTHTKLEIKEPPTYIIYFHNNQVTTMEGVVLVLQRTFNYSAPIAFGLMIEIHEKDGAQVYEGPHDVARVFYDFALEFCANAPRFFNLHLLRIELKEKS